MASPRYSTAGMYICYACETTKGSRPTNGYKLVPEIKGMPSFNPSPEPIESTTLLETEFKTYVRGLRDLGGALEYGANLTEDLITSWSECVTAHDTAAAEDKATWFSVVHPKLTKAIFFQGDPSPIGLNEASVNAMAETTLYITPESAPIWADKPTLDSGSQTVLGGG